jgi:predicted metal-dependent peptidase
MVTKLVDILALARWKAALAVPYLGRALWAASFVESTDVDTFAIDERWRVYVNPGFAAECAKDGSLPGAIVHEILHPTLRHGPRAKAIHADDHRRWNTCGDCEINARVDAAGVKLPSCGVHARDLGAPDNLTAEELYQRPEKKDKKGACAGGSGAGAPHPCEGNAPADAPPGLSEAEGELVRVSTAAAIVEHEKTKPGTVPAGLLRWAETICEAPPVDWRSLVQARIRNATDARRGPAPTYARPARRKAPFVLPVHRLPVPRIALVLDTSGSMGESDLGAALACTADACLALGKVTVTPCDAHAYESVEVRQVDDLREYLRGGGGTDMVAGIANAAEVCPDAIVVVTDGETSWPTDAPDVPCVVVLTREPHYCAAPPVWAEVVNAY